MYLKLITIMGIFDRKKKPKEALEIKTYTFSVEETVKQGEIYTYTVKGTSQKNAFKKLVIWLFAMNSEDVPEEDIKSQCQNISYPGQSVFTYSGMLKWFAKRISGYKGNYQKQLEKYAKAHDIKLDKGR
jgi:hypothetical protein